MDYLQKRSIIRNRFTLSCMDLFKSLSFSKEHCEQIVDEQWPVIPKKSTLNWYPVEFADGVYYELELDKGFFVLFDKGGYFFEINSGGSWGKKKLTRFFGTIQGCERFVSWVTGETREEDFVIAHRDDGRGFKTAHSKPLPLGHSWTGEK